MENQNENIVNNDNNELSEFQEKVEGQEITDVGNVVYDVSLEEPLSCEGVVEEEINALTEGENISNYYNEKTRKSDIKEGFKISKIRFSKIAAVSIISSILGGLVVGCFMQFAAPVVTSKLNEVTGNKFPGKILNTSLDNNLVKKIEIETIDSPVVAIAQKVGPSVVGIKSTVRVTNFFFGETESNPQGSGIIIRSDGYIMTNNHVIKDALSGASNTIVKGSKIEVFLPNQQDEPYEAIVVGRDEKTDLAVLKIDANGLPAIELGNSDDLKVGELVVAVGNPGGLEYMGSITAGIVSGLNRTFPIGDGKELKLIQTDAAINPGNSGGALVNSKGQLIGINTAKISGEGFEGLGFAIPVNKANEITKDLIEFKYVKGRPLLGITGDSRYTEAIAKANNYPVGVLVSDVTPLSGAYKAGIKRGDVITKFDGKAVKSVDEINKLKNIHKPGDEVTVEVYREGKYITMKVTLTEEGAASEN